MKLCTKDMSLTIPTNHVAMLPFNSIQFNFNSCFTVVMYYAIVKYGLP